MTTIDIHNSHECHVCGELTNPHFEYHNPTNGQYYCYDCANNLDNNIHYCAECGDLRNDTVIVDGVRVCEDCCTDSVHYCVVCGERHTDSNLRSVIFGINGETELRCTDCVRTTATECEDCGELYCNTLIERDEDENHHWCIHCAKDHRVTCAECGEEMWDFESFEVDGKTLCRDCVAGATGYSFGRKNKFVDEEDVPRDDYVKSYHWHHGDQTYFYHENSLVSTTPAFDTPYIGIELEMTCEGHYSADEIVEFMEEECGGRFYYEDDSSVASHGHGLEAILRPHTIGAFYEIDWHELLDGLKDRGCVMQDNGKCGLHVHISRTMFGDRGTNLRGFYQFMINNFDDIDRMSRRKCNASMGDSHHYAKRFNDMDGDASSVADAIYYSSHDRYYFINNTNDDTVEFRLWRGTGKATSFLAKIDFVWKAAEYCAEYGAVDHWDKEDPTREVLDTMETNTLEYIKEWGCEKFKHIAKELLERRNAVVAA